MQKIRLHFVQILSLILFLQAYDAIAQVKEYDYFPAPFCKANNIQVVTTYHAKTDTSADTPTKLNRIRIANTITSQTIFDENGKKVKSVKYAEGGKKIVQERTLGYSDQGLQSWELLKYYNTNISDSTRLIQSTFTEFTYDKGGLLIAKTSFLISPNKRVPIDSVAIIWVDASFKQQEQIWVNLPTPTLQYTKYSYYLPALLEIQTVIGSKQGNRDLYIMDDQWRIKKEMNFATDEASPRLESYYDYDTNGNLSEIRMVPDWQYFSRDETVVKRQNRFDKYGKLIEVRIDYGDGKRLVDFYDYATRADLKE